MAHTVSATFGDVEPQYLGDALPKGDYALTVVAAEVRYGKETAAPYTNLQLQVAEGEYAKRTIFHRLFYSEKALPFTLGTIKLICGGEVPDALRGIDRNDSEALATAAAEALRGLTFIAPVVVTKDEVYGDKNEIRPTRERRN